MLEQRAKDGADRHRAGEPSLFAKTARLTIPRPICRAFAAAEPALLDVRHLSGAEPRLALEHRRPARVPFQEDLLEGKRVSARLASARVRRAEPVEVSLV